MRYSTLEGRSLGDGNLRIVVFNFKKTQGFWLWIFILSKDKVYLHCVPSFYATSKKKNLLMEITIFLWLRE